MSIPTASRAWYVRDTNEGSFENSLKLESNVPIPPLAETECLVQIEAVSLNYRDLLIAKGLYTLPISLPRIPCSDAAAVVVAVGNKVTRFKRGERVCTVFCQQHLAGPATLETLATDIGGTIDGTLRQYAIFPEYGLTHAPAKLTPVESSTLSCAPLTAWNSLFGLQSKAVRPGDIVLTQGTGGVSLAAIQFALAAGAVVIATTSSENKAKKLRDMGVHHVINYKSTPNWGEIAKSLTPNSVGVDHVVEVGGAGTLKQSLKAIKLEGVINIVGFLSGKSEDQPFMIEALSNFSLVRGIAAGSKQQFEAMIRAIDANNIHPIVDEKQFRFEDVPAAYEYQWSQGNYGKVVIKF